MRHCPVHHHAPGCFALARHQTRVTSWRYRSSQQITGQGPRQKEAQKIFGPFPSLPKVYLTARGTCTRRSSLNPNKNIGRHATGTNPCCVGPTAGGQTILKPAAFEMLTVRGRHTTHCMMKDFEKRTKSAAPHAKAPCPDYFVTPCVYSYTPISVMANDRENLQALLRVGR
jgi:hypothetical protein